MAIKKIITGIINQGYKVKLIAYRNPVKADNTLNTRMQELVFHILGTKKTVSIPFFLDNLVQASNSKRIWNTNLARQRKLANENPDLNYLVDIEGMDRKDALTQINAVQENQLTSHVGKEFTVWFTSATKDGRTYYNYQPYAPTLPEEDATGFEDISDLETKKVK